MLVSAALGDVTGDLGLLAEGSRCSLGEKQQLYDHRNDGDGQYPTNELLTVRKC